MIAKVPTGPERAIVELGPGNGLTLLQLMRINRIMSIQGFEHALIDYSDLSHHPSKHLIFVFQMEGEVWSAQIGILGQVSSVQCSGDPV